MTTIISGDGTITGLTATGISAVQQLPAGSVLQVVSSTLTTLPSTSSTTFTDTPSMSVNITPKFSTSKVLVIVTINGVTSNDGTSRTASYALTDGSNNIICYIGSSNVAPNAAGSVNGYFSLNYLHSPATTSSFTYKIRWKCNAGGLYMNNYGDIPSAPYSTITVMEVAQ
jgi:hypothetical protein